MLKETVTIPTRNPGGSQNYDAQYGLSGNSSLSGSRAAESSWVVSSRHPVAVDFEERYAYWTRSYRGGKHLDDIPFYIHRFPRESDHTGDDGLTNYQRRVTRAANINLCKPVLNLFSDAIFERNIARDIPEDENGLEFSKFAGNCNRRGWPLGRFFRDLSIWVQVHGVVGLLVDSPTVNEQLTVAEQEKKNLFPYLVRIKAPDILDWGLDSRDGDLSWVKIRMSSYEDEFPFVTRQENKSHMYLVYTRTGWQIFNDDGDEVSYGSHPLGIVPFRFVYNGEEQENIGEGDSSLADISNLNRALNNIATLMDQNCYDQAFSTLVIPGEPNSSSNIEERNVGATVAIVYPADGQPPSFLSPDIGQYGILERQQLTLADKIYWSAQQRYGPSKSKPIVESGVAKASDNGIASFARNIEDVENWAHKVWRAWSESKSVDLVESEFSSDESTGALIVSRYPTSFDLTRLYDVLQDLVVVMALPFATPTVKREASNIAISKAMPSLTADVRKQIGKEQEDMLARLLEQADRGDESGSIFGNEGEDEEAEDDEEVEEDEEDEEVEEV